MMDLSTPPSWLKEPIRSPPDEVSGMDPPIDTITMPEVTRPIITSMKMLGMWHDRPPRGHPIGPSNSLDDQPDDQSNQQFGWNRCWMVLERLGFFYHALVMTVLWFDFFRTSIAISSNLNLYNASYLCWFIQTALINTVLLAACFRRCKIERLYEFWRSAAANHKKESEEEVVADIPASACLLHLERKTFLRAGRFAAFSGWLFVLSTFPVSAYFTLTDESLSGILCDPWTDELSCGLLLINSFFALAVHKLPVAFLCLICYILSRQFDALTAYFLKQCPAGTPATSDLLEATRRRHNTLCRITAQCDYVFSALVAIIYATNIPLLIFTMFSIYDTKDASTYFIWSSIYWCFSNLLNIVLVSTFCAVLNEKAHSLRRPVFELHVDATDTKTSHVHLLLISRLNGPNIGLSFVGFFTITKNVILTITGLVLTYFTLLIDLGEDDTPVPCLNVSSTITT